MIFSKIILYYLFHSGIKHTPESRIAIIRHGSIPLPGRRGSHYLYHDDLYQTHNPKVSLRIAIPGLTCTSLEMVSPPTRKGQALTFPNDLPATSVTGNFLPILLHKDHVQVKGCAKASGEQFMMPVNECNYTFHCTRNRAIKH